MPATTKIYPTVFTHKSKFMVGIPEANGRLVYHHPELVPADTIAEAWRRYLTLEYGGCNIKGLENIESMTDEEVMEVSKSAYSAQTTIYTGDLK